MTIPRSEVEALARELIALPLAELSATQVCEQIAATLGDADPEVAQAALDRAAEIMHERTTIAIRHAEMLRTIVRLSAATGCPDGTDAGAWLEGLGLIERDDGGAYRLTPKAKLRAV
jgi:hypothetical protein